MHDDDHDGIESPMFHVPRDVHLRVDPRADRCVVERILVILRWFYCGLVRTRDRSARWPLIMAVRVRVILWCFHCGEWYRSSYVQLPNSHQQQQAVCAAPH
ncbi:expressed unknown protein [Seminavis robusta]|uniref:Uncharacterized protein n=1 Tax=Seminavis robusta TaxID=568900 RepID=A0A9N8H2B6_9STRA|nr:expressed unknown protein [Seminavis robusta]|eukprot:Sro16_g011680.1 n/a (101) ;mRNA; r:67442-68243